MMATVLYYTDERHQHLYVWRFEMRQRFLIIISCISAFLPAFATEVTQWQYVAPDGTMKVLQKSVKDGMKVYTLKEVDLDGKKAPIVTFGDTVSIKAKTKQNLNGVVVLSYKECESIYWNKRKRWNKFTKTTTCETTSSKPTLSGKIHEGDTMVVKPAEVL